MEHVDCLNSYVSLPLFVSSSELFWNAMEKQFVSRTRTNNDVVKLDS